jgi:hypothetical protein
LPFSLCPSCLSPHLTGYYVAGSWTDPERQIQLFPLNKSVPFLQILPFLMHIINSPFLFAQLRQAKIRESLGLTEKYCISDGPWSGSGTTHVLPTHWLLDGNHLVSPLP